MCLYDRNFLHVIQIIQQHVPTYRLFGHRLRYMTLILRIRRARDCFLIMRQGEEVVFGVRREGADAAGVEGGDLLVEELHVADVVDEDDFFEEHGEAFAVHFHGDDHAVEGEFADCGVFLIKHQICDFHFL